jgi:AcrR family transcriptional regulator
MTERRQRRSPISREEGERRLIDATLDLCRERPLAEVTVRDIGRRADVNHGFVHVWFGSKGGVVLAACHRLIDEIAPHVDAGELRFLGVRSPEVVLLIRLLAWLQADTDQPLLGDRPRPIIETSADALQRLFGFTPATAVTLAEITTAGIAGTALVGTALRLDDEAMMHTWLEMLEVYAASLGARDDAGDNGSHT